MEYETEQRAYERACIASAAFSLLGVAAIAAGFIGGLVTMNMWWLLSVAGGVLVLLAANPGDW